MIKGFDDQFDFDFDGAAEDTVAAGNLVVIDYEGISGLVRRRRRRFRFIEETIQNAEASGSLGVIGYSSSSGKATAEGRATSSITQFLSFSSSGKTTGKKVSVVSGKVFGDAVASGTTTLMSVSCSSGDHSTRFDNDFLMSETIVHPVDVDNDLLLAA